MGSGNTGKDILTMYSFMAHPETLLPMPEVDDPVERFVSVVKFYLSGWHIKPPYANFTSLKSQYCANEILQRSQETTQPSSRRNLYLLLAIPR